MTLQRIPEWLSLCSLQWFWWASAFPPDIEGAGLLGQCIHFSTDLWVWGRGQGGKNWLEKMMADFKGSVQSPRDQAFYCVCAQPDA